MMGSGGDTTPIDTYYCCSLLCLEGVYVFACMTVCVVCVVSLYTHFRVSQYKLILLGDRSFGLIMLVSV